MAFSFTVAAVAYLIMPHLDGIWLWAALAAAIGFAFGTLFAVTAPLAGDCFGMAHFGAIFGLIFTAYGFLQARSVRGSAAIFWISPRAITLWFFLVI